MSNPVKVDELLLDNLAHVGPLAIQDIKVFHNSEPTSNKSAFLAGSTLSNPEIPITPHPGQKPDSNKECFVPQRRYYLEGRIIHKRKLSKKLFFLDVVLVRPKNNSKNSSKDGSGTIITDKSVSMTKESLWEEIGTARISPETVTNAKVQTDRSIARMEVIARYPTHTLKELDDLWQRVQLGAVIRVYGDIEVSERKNWALARQQQEKKQQQQQTEQQDSEQHSSDIQGQKLTQDRWSTILHCLDFEILEPWLGNDAFDPNSGAAEISNAVILDGKAGGSKSSDKKRKSGDVSDLTASPRPDKQHQRGDDTQPHCKFWLNSGRCNKEVCIFWHESDPAKLKVERRRWVEERIQAKRQISHHCSDPHQNTTKNQHRERALYFAKWLIDTFSYEYLNSGSGVLDVAGGRGDLSWELQTRQGIRSTVVEPRADRGMRKWQRRWLEKFKANNHIDISPIKNNQDQKPLASIEHCEAGSPTSASTSTDMTEEQEPDANKTLDGLDDFIPTMKTLPLQATEPSRIQAMMDDQFLKTHQDLVGTASIMVGLHPDQATEPIVRAAIQSKKPFAVIPCCVFGRDNPHRRLPLDSNDVEAVTDAVSNTTNSSDGDAVNKGKKDEDATTRPVTSYEDFVTWLATLHPNIKTAWLNFEGMNRVLYWDGS
ncbi:hypothetical protein FBU30_008452 [Linnemannia zychae]|nr:hypothetical protein FBU30_008452 [Linnemannia zychae]